MVHAPAIRVVESSSDGLAIILLEELPFTIDERQYVIPQGYVSDGASVPRFFWRLLSPQIDPLTLVPSIVHDWLYEYGALLGYTRRQCDRWYHAALNGRGYPLWKCDLTYVGIRLFGWRHWE